MLRRRLSATTARPFRSRRALPRVLLAGVVAVSIAVVGVGAAGAFTVPHADERCTERRDLVAIRSPLDRPMVALAGSFTRCSDPAHGLLTYANHTPVAWTVTDAVSSTRSPEKDAVSAVLARAWLDRDPHGIVVAPGDTIRLPDWVGAYTWRPDIEATRLYLAAAAAVGVQTSAGTADGHIIDRATAPSFDIAAAQCARAAVFAPDGAAPQTTDSTLEWTRLSAALSRARHDASCSRAWERSSRAAEAAGWTLPTVRDAFGRTGVRDPELSSAADRAARWFDESALFVRAY